MSERDEAAAVLLGEQDRLEVIAAENGQGWRQHQAFVDFLMTDERWKPLSVLMMRCMNGVPRWAIISVLNGAASDWLKQRQIDE